MHVFACECMCSVYREPACIPVPSVSQYEGRPLAGGRPCSPVSNTIAHSRRLSLCRRLRTLPSAPCRATRGCPPWWETYRGHRTASPPHAGGVCTGLKVGTESASGKMQQEKPAQARHPLFRGEEGQGVPGGRVSGLL
uniref:Uncharacterized protein n=1 Tax=Myotis myotis TaxID=51298 RepID=A0A7J7U5H0_MYOMY|nr:hypothetical protein mMyoMyo1_008909 [Myotis myotis]